LITRKPEADARHRALCARLAFAWQRQEYRRRDGSFLARALAGTRPLAAPESPQQALAAAESLVRAGVAARAAFAHRRAARGAAFMKPRLRWHGVAERDALARAAC